MYSLRVQAPQKQKAAFRIGQKVTCDYYPGTEFKVSAKEWDANGTVFYTLWRMLGIGVFSRMDTVGGLREKYLNKA